MNFKNFMNFSILNSMVYFIVGLGNPGEEYVHTRHNTGRIILEYFRKAGSFSDWEPNKKLRALVSGGKVQGDMVSIVLPETFMNKSGASVVLVVKNKKQAERLVVVHDDLDLPLGSFKIVFNRGSGGHRGVESIRRAIKTEGFIRIKVGISPRTPSGKTKKPKGEKAVNNFILGTFKPKELELLKKVSKKVSGALTAIVVDGKERAMNEFN